MVELCDHMVSLILEKATLTTLVMCKCLSKRWLRLATEEQLLHEIHVPGHIVRTIYGRPPYHTMLLPSDSSREKPRDISLRLPGGDEGIMIVASGNGLLFCVRETSDGRICDDCYLYNPCTWDYVVVPRPHQTPRAGAHGLNIGLANYEDDMLIVSAFPMSRGYHEHRFGFEIYSLALGEWRVSDEVSEPRATHDPMEGLVCRIGAVFWKSTLHWCFWSKYMLEFNPVTEKSRWSYVPYPQAFGLDSYLAGWMGEHRGKLFFIAVAQSRAGNVGELLFFYRTQVCSEWWAQRWRRLLTCIPGADTTVAPHIFLPVGLIQRPCGDAVLLSTPCGRTVFYDLEIGTMEIVMDAILHVDPPLSDPANPFPLEPQYHFYTPTINQIHSKTKRRQVDGYRPKEFEVDHQPSDTVISNVDLLNSRREREGTSLLDDDNYYYNEYYDNGSYYAELFKQRKSSRRALLPSF